MLCITDFIFPRWLVHVDGSYKKDCNYVGVLSMILKNFDSAIWAENTMDLVALVKDSDASDYAGPIHAFTSMCTLYCLGIIKAALILPLFVWCRPYLLLLLPHERLVTCLTNSLAPPVIVPSTGMGLCSNAPPAKQKLPFLNKAWKAVKVRCETIVGCV